jgi:hypothetical protein
MSQTSEKRRRQPALSASISQKKRLSFNTAESAPQGIFVNAVKLRERGLTLEEVAIDIRSTRLDVFRHFLRTLSRDKRLKLALPT